MKATLSTPQQGSTSQLTDLLGGRSAQLATPRPFSKADIYATQSKYAQIREDKYASLGGVA